MYVAVFLVAAFLAVFVTSVTPHPFGIACLVVIAFPS